MSSLGERRKGQYPDEFRVRAVRMVQESFEEYSSRKRNPHGCSGFLRSRVRPATQVLVRGVEPICAVLYEYGTPIAPNTYYEHRTRVMNGNL